MAQYRDAPVLPASLLRRAGQERGLELSHEKTRITRVEDGFDFLGQTVRRFQDGKVVIKPSKKSVKAFLAEVREVIDLFGNA